MSMFFNKNAEKKKKREMSDTVAIFHTSRFNFLRFLETIATFAVAEASSQAIVMKPQVVSSILPPATSLPA